MNEPKRSIMFSAYNANPALLALELEILLEPCTDANFAVLHNKAIDVIRELCGKRVETKDDLGNVLDSHIELECKDKLALHLARSVLGYARREG